MQKTRDRIRDGVRSLKDRVIGVSEEAASSVADASAELGATARAVPSKVASATGGSPVAVGIIAFGAGALAAALIPESTAERRAVQQLSENLGPVAEPLQEAGKAVAQDVRTSVTAAATDLRSAAADAAAHVGAAATAGAQQVRTAATEAATHTVHDVSEQGHAVIEQSRRSLES